MTKKKIKKVKEITSDKIKAVKEVKDETKRDKSELEREVSESEEIAEIGEGERAEDITPVISAREETREIREIPTEERREVRTIPQETETEGLERSYDFAENPYLAQNLRTTTGGEAAPIRRNVDYREYSPVMSARTTGGEAPSPTRNFGGEAVAPTRRIEDANRIEEDNLRKDYVGGQSQEKRKRRWMGEV